MHTSAWLISSAANQIRRKRNSDHIPLDEVVHSGLVQDTMRVACGLPQRDRRGSERVSGRPLELSQDSSTVLLERINRKSADVRLQCECVR